MASIYNYDEKKIESLINRHDVISFDVFDTLLRRPFLAPTDLFNYVENHHGLYDFKYCRITAENQARKKYPDQTDIRYSQIYENLAVSPQYELEAESRALYPRKKLVDLFHLAKKLGKKTAILSDMYLDKSFIETTLKKYDIIADYIYVSGHDQVGKFNGSMFSELVKSLNVTPNAILHFGDNKHSDYIAAVKMGIKAIHLSNEAPFFPDNGLGKFTWEVVYNLKSTNSWPASQLGAAIRDYYEDWKPKDSWEELGATVSGPLAFCISRWLKDNCELNGLKKLVFLARDGWLPKYAFDHIKGTIDTYYFPINRTVIVRAALFSMEDALFVQTVPHLPISKREFLNKYYFTNPKIFEELESFIDLESVMKSRDDLIDFLNIAKSESPTLVSEVNTLKSDISTILEDVKIFDAAHQVGFFDIGWIGSVFGLMTKIWPQLQHCRFYFFGTELNFLVDHAKTSSLFFERGLPENHRNLCFQSIELVETTLTSHEHSAFSISNNQNQLRIEYQGNLNPDVEKQREHFSRMVRSAERFLDFAKEFSFFEKWSVERHLVYALIKTLMETKCALMNEALGSIKHQVRSGQTDWIKISGNSDTPRYLSTLVRWAKGRPMKAGHGSRWASKYEDHYFQSLKGARRLFAYPFYHRRKRVKIRD